MTLIDAMLRPIVKRIPEPVDDGEGGVITTWRDGDEFQGAITAHKASWTWVAQHGTSTDYYNVTTRLNAPKLMLFDVIRDEDGQTYRITGNAREFPSPMTARYRRYTAEQWEEAS